MSWAARRLYEGEFEGEEFLGTITRSIGGLLGQQEYEGEFEGEEFLGTIARGIGGLLGQGEYEFENEYEGEGEWELEGEWEGEFEGEEFFRRIARGIGRFVQRAAPVLRQVARVAAPIVGTAVGGPVGGMLARGITSQLEGESEFEGEWESEYEEEGEYEYEARVTQPEALAEYMAAAASRAASLAEAEAMIGGCTIIIVNRAGQRSLHRVLPHLVRGSAALTSVLRSRPATAPAVRAVPTVVRGTVRTLTQRAAAGYPVTPRAAAHAMAIQTRRVLGQPASRSRLCAATYVLPRLPGGSWHARALRPALAHMASGPVYGAPRTFAVAAPPCAAQRVQLSAGPLRPHVAARRECDGHMQTGRYPYRT